jgi:UPF0176 protein
MPVATFYKFVEIDALEPLRAHLLHHGNRLGLKGTILLAEEGINATLTAPDRALRDFVALVKSDERFGGMPVKYSDAAQDNPVFHRFKVRVRPEIVTFGQPQIHPGERTGEHVGPKRWNELLADPDVVVIDTRNHYEIGIGTFPGSIDPHTTSFREFADFVSTTLDPESTPRIAMCCTGGIRCEKASAYMLEQGYEEVYQLDGGILKYLEEVAEEDNQWQGECFVFDQRVSVNPQLGQGAYLQCFACRSPVSIEDQASPDYVEGVSCPACISRLDDERRASLMERQKQVELAAARGEQHVGAVQVVGDKGA